MPRHNEQKEANDSEIISDREIWSAIRYLDPESDHRECDIAATVAIVAVICSLYGRRVVSLPRTVESGNSEKRRRSRRAFSHSERTQEK